MTTVTYTWRPVDGDEVVVTLHRDYHAQTPHYDIRLGETDLGSVFHDENPIYGWRFRRYGVREKRGSHLRDHIAAVSALLFCLRQERKV